MKYKWISKSISKKKLTKTLCDSVNHIRFPKEVLPDWTHRGKQGTKVCVRNQLDVTFVLSFISLLQGAQHVSGNHVPIFRSWRLRNLITHRTTPAYNNDTTTHNTSHNHKQNTHRETHLNNTTHCYSTYQHEAITSHSRQLLMMGICLPETCWATVRREIKNTKSDM